VATIANSIATGQIDVGIGAGFESMTKAKKPEEVEEFNPKIFDNPGARDCLNTMGQTSENVAEQYGISREAQDQFAFESQQKAAVAVKEGRFAKEIAPVTTEFITPEGETKAITVTKDDGIRPTTLEGLAKLKPAFKEGGSTTAGNASQTSDGAAAVLLMRRSVAKKLGLPIIGVFRHFTTIGVPPSVMGIGPAFAIPKLLEKTGLKINDIDIYEINEAFASQAVYCIQKLGIPKEKVNPNGGAIAFGHPLACTGSRQIATILNELHRTKGKYGVVSMCMGTGAGAAALIERE
jgi:acetyl-CoA acyltransferase 1